MKKTILAVVIVGLGLLLTNISCDSVTYDEYHEHGCLATSSPIASDIGRQILQDGGNAFDAAVAVGFALAVCYPQAGNVGGGGFAVTYSVSNDKISALDFRETAPRAASENMYIDETGEIIPESSLLGAKAAGVPGTVAGLHELWREYGSQPWDSLLTPAINLADTGFIVGDYLARSLEENQDKLAAFPATREIFFPAGKLLQAGDRLIQKDLAATLTRIRLDTLKGFYAGKTAALIVEAMKENGGLIDSADLAGYHSSWREPLHFTFDSLDIYSMPPPSSGGIILAMILRLIEPYDFALYMPESPEFIHLFAEACRLAYADRAVHLGDPDFIDMPVAELLSDEYLKIRRNLIDLKRAGNSARIGSGIPEPTGDSASTTHFSVIDSLGNAVSLTYTINTSFGSKLVVKGAGFLLNNEMDDFSIKPNEPNYYGLIGGPANAIAPGKRMLSSMCPTIIMKKDRYRRYPYLVLGSVGGSKIITTVAQSIINMTKFELNSIETVRFPRFHHQWLPDTLYLETGGFDINVKQDLISRGHIIKEINPYGDLQMIYVADSALVSAVSDPRRDGASRGY